MGKPKQEGAMTNSSNPNLVDHRQLQAVPPAGQREASSLTLAVVMTAIAGFFIAGIASAFIYSKDSMLASNAPKPGISAPAETTGSGHTK
jgi:hypothetical protein